MAIRRMEGGLAKQIDQEKVVQEWPGLAHEVAKICLAIGIPDVNHNISNKRDINIALRKHDRGEITEKFGKYKKLDKIVDDDPTEAKDYMKVKTLSDTRLIFRLRTEMLEVKDNMRNRYKRNNVYCEACDSNTA